MEMQCEMGTKFFSDQQFYASKGYNVFAEPTVEQFGLDVELP
jgi:hypothetical protein